MTKKVGAEQQQKANARQARFDFDRTTDHAKKKLVR
jgi:hypothetical protein